MTDRPHDLLEESTHHRRYRLRDGLSDGVEVVEITRGGTTAVVCPTRGMGVLEMRVGDTRVGWDSPVAGPVHPALVNLNSRGGLGWLDGFSELLVRCGLAFNGPPGTDEAAGPIAQEVTLHGRIANTPARDVRVEADGESVTVLGSVEENTLFGPNLSLHTQIRLDADGLHVADTVVNLAGSPAEMQLLYHINVGPPFLAEGSRIRVAAKDACPRDGRAAEGAADWATCLPPTPGYAEQAYFFEATAPGFACLSAPGGRTFRVDFDAETLPCLTAWKCTQSEADGYVLGLEPGTNFPNFKATERDRGRVVSIPAGGEWSTRVSLSVTDSPPDLGDVAMRPRPTPPMAAE